jgi:hypothetical protein
VTAWLWLPLAIPAAAAAAVWATAELQHRRDRRDRELWQRKWSR